MPIRGFSNQPGSAHPGTKTQHDRPDAAGTEEVRQSEVRPPRTSSLDIFAHMQREIAKYDESVTKTSRNRSVVVFVSSLSAFLFGCTLYSFQDVQSDIQSCYFHHYRAKGVQAVRRAYLRLNTIGWSPVDYLRDDPYTVNYLMNHYYYNPIGLGAGFDVDAAAAQSVGRMGFGFIECGSVTVDGTPEPSPASFLPADRSIQYEIVQTGSADKTAANLRNVDREDPLGRFVNIGINLQASRKVDTAVDEITSMISKMPGASYFAIRLDQNWGPEGIRQIVKAARSSIQELELVEPNMVCVEPGPVPLLVKMPSDAPEEIRAAVAELCCESLLEGVVVGGFFRTENVVGGALAKESTLECVRDMWKKTDGKTVLIGSGGVMTGRDILDLIESGCSLVQVSSAWYARGPATARELKKELSQMMIRENYADIKTAIGIYHFPARKAKKMKKKKF